MVREKAKETLMGLFLEMVKLLQRVGARNKFFKELMEELKGGEMVCSHDSHMLLAWPPQCEVWKIMWQAQSEG